MQLRSYEAATKVAESEGLVEVSKSAPVEGKTYGAVIARYVTKHPTILGKDCFWARPDEIRYLGTMEKYWRTGSGDGLETFRTFTHGSKTVTVRAGDFLCWVEMPPPETEPENKVPVDGSIY
jgi:hypothetical protein